MLQFGDVNGTELFSRVKAALVSDTGIKESISGIYRRSHWICVQRL